MQQRRVNKMASAALACALAIAPGALFTSTGLAALLPQDETAGPSANTNVTIPAGTNLTVRVAQKLESGKTDTGQTWQGTLVSDVARNGRIIVPAGSPVSGVVSDSKDSGRLKAPGILSVRVQSVNSIPVTTDVITRDGQGHTRSNVEKVGGGTAAGALIGGLAGGGAGAGIGAAAGAGAGLFGALFTGKKQAEIKPESVLTFVTQ